MTRSRRRRTKRSRLLPEAPLRRWASALGALALVCTVHLAIGATPGTQIWKGFYTLLVAQPADDGAIASRLAASRIDALGASTAEVRFTDFSGPARVSVAHLGERFDPLDPRLDPYMRGLGGYFRASGWVIAYARAAESLPIFRLRVAGALRGLRWEIADADGFRETACLLLLLLCAAGLIARARLKPGLLVAGLAPWLPIAATGSLGALLPAAFLYLAWALLAEEALPAIEGALEGDGFERPLSVRSAAATACALAVAADVGSGGLLLPLAEALFADLLLCACLLAFRAARSGARDHRLFVPVEVLRPGALRSAPGIEAAVFAGLLACFMAFPIVLARDRPADVAIPIARAYPDPSGLTWSALARLARLKRSGDLPDLSDYLAHRSYQDSLASGRAYGFPRKNEQVVIPTFRREGLKIERTSRVAERFDTAWFRRAMRARDGIVPLLKAERMPATVARESLGALRARALPLGEWWLLSLLFFAPIMLARGAPVRSRGGARRPA